MLYYDRIDLSERFDVAKSNNSKEYMVCHYCFSNYGFRFQISVCNGCHDLKMLCLNPIQDWPFWDCSQIRKAGKDPSLKSVTEIL